MGRTAQSLHRVTIFSTTAAMCAALVLLGLRAVSRLETWWDAWLYHVPFAAHYGGLGIRYSNTDPEIAGLLDGAPPLPFVVHGLLWRFTGSLNAIGVRNYAAFLLFLYFAVRVLRARFAVVVMVALTSPLVLIHMATTYYDLFANSFLAIGVSGIAVAVLFDRGLDRGLLVWILAGLTAAAWSKPVLLPMVCASLSFLLIYELTRHHGRKREFVALTTVACAAGALPYVRNWVVFHNPIWPNRVPFFDEMPYTQDFLAREVPPLLKDLPPYQIFLRSLFEIGQPTEYPDRARWILDQGRTLAGYRCGGFWGVAVLSYLVAMGVLAALLFQRRAVPFLLGALATLMFVAVFPDSHNLRYFLFLPLTWAAVIGALEKALSKRRPLLALVTVLGCTALFAYVTRINREYYRVDGIDYAQAARSWGADSWWAALDPGETYCAVGPPYPSAFFLTGPTMQEFAIDERRSVRECPHGAVVLDWKAPPEVPGVLGAENGRLVAAGVRAHYDEHDPARAIGLYRAVLRRDPEHYGALFQIAKATEALGDSRGALAAWRAAKRVELLRGYVGENVAYSSARIAELALRP